MCKYWIKNCIYARYTFFFFFLKRSKTCGPRLTDRESAMLRDALTSWKIGNYFSSLFLTSTSGIRRKEWIEANVCSDRSSRARISARNIAYKLVHLWQVIEQRSNIYESRERERTGKFQLTRSFHNHGGGFRSVRYSALLHTRLSSLVPRMFPFPCIIAIPYPYWLFSGYPRARVYPGRRENRGIESRGLEERMISLAGFVTRNWILREIRQTFRFQYLTRYFFPFDSLLNRPFVN